MTNKNHITAQIEILVEHCSHRIFSTTTCTCCWHCPKCGKTGCTNYASFYFDPKCKIIEKRCPMENKEIVKEKENN